MKNKNIILSLIFATAVLGISLVCWFKPDGLYSEAERRPLAEKPEFTIQSVLSGEYIKGFESYVTDQFPARDSFRSVKALFSEYVFNKKDNNGLYQAEGHISKLEYPVNPEMTDYAQERFDYLYNTYLKGENVNIYLSLVPDKNFFLAERNGYLSIDYDKFAEDFKKKVPYMEYIDINHLLTIEDYYRTDSHWKQESITDVAQYIGEKMGVDVRSEYEVNTLDIPFNGVYLGQSALPVKPDTIKYLTSDVLDNCKVTYFDSGIPEEGEIYNFEKAQGKDPYEFFLSGTTPLVVIENPSSDSEKELVIFRDSYGSSMAPLLVPGYDKTTVVDIRYISSNFVGNFIEFDNQDVLFLYSTTLINNSLAMH